MVIANYLFDTLKHDVWQVRAGELRQGLLEIGSSRAEDVDNPTDASVLDRLVPKWSFETDPRAVVQPNCYSNPVWNQVLQVSKVAPFRIPLVVFM